MSCERFDSNNIDCKMCPIKEFVTNGQPNTLNIERTKAAAAGYQTTRRSSNGWGANNGPEIITCSRGFSIEVKSSFLSLLDITPDIK